MWAFLGCLLSVACLRGAEPAKQADMAHAKPAREDLIVNQDEVRAEGRGEMAGIRSDAEGVRIAAEILKKTRPVPICRRYI